MNAGRIERVDRCIHAANVTRDAMPTTLPLQSRTPTQVATNVRGGASDAITNMDLLFVLGFCVLGLLIALIVMLCFQDLGALIESYNQF
jgi:hypothetical protein